MSRRNPGVHSTSDSPTRSAHGGLLRPLGAFALALVIWAAPGVLPAAELIPGAFDAANKLYEQSKFTEAAAAYQKLLASGQASPAIYFNLGNAYFKSGQMGRAVAAYRQAELITPRDPDIRANLQFARNQVQSPTVAVPGWQKWLQKLSLNEWTWLGVVCFWAWLGVLILTRWRSELRVPLKKFAITLGLAAVLANAGLFGALQVDRVLQTAVIVVPEAVVRLGPLDESQKAFIAHDGAELQVLDHKEEWLQVALDARRVGWVRRDQVIVTPQS
jgi:tetratricopeptide (TPR) repeat protein